MIYVRCNPTSEMIDAIIDESPRKAANWLLDTEDGGMWYWPAGTFRHSTVAKFIGAERYYCGLVSRSEIEGLGSGLDFRSEREALGD